MRLQEPLTESVSGSLAGWRRRASGKELWKVRIVAHDACRLTREKVSEFREEQRQELFPESVPEILHLRPRFDDGASFEDRRHLAGGVHDLGEYVQLLVCKEGFVRESFSW